MAECRLPERCCQYADKLDILADSLTAAVVGASGTEIKNKVAHNANINVTGDITTSGKQSYIANNTLNHDVDLKGSGYGGGSVNVNDMDNVLKYTAGVNIDSANLSGTGSAGSIEALAYTDGKINYSNTLKSAGVVPVTIAASKNVITYDNSINVTAVSCRRRRLIRISPSQQPMKQRQPLILLLIPRAVLWVQLLLKQITL